MSKPLSTRIQDLENEIQCMLNNPIVAAELKSHASTSSKRSSQGSFSENVIMESVTYEERRYTNSSNNKNCGEKVPQKVSTNSNQQSFEVFYKNGDFAGDSSRVFKGSTCYFDPKSKLFICAPPKVELLQGPDLHASRLLCAPPAVVKLGQKDEDVLNAAEMPDVPINDSSNMRASAEKLKESGEIIIRRLRSELEQKIAELGRAEEEKKKALNMTHELQQKYEKLHMSKSVDLANKRDAVEKERRTLTKKVEKIEVKAIKSAKKVKRHKQQLGEAIQERDGQLKDLSSATAKLVESYKEKQCEFQKLSDFQQQLLENINELQKENCYLKDTNGILVQNLKDIQETLKKERHANQKLADSKIGELEEKLAQSKKREQGRTDEVILLEMKLEKMKNAQAMVASNAEERINKILLEKNHLNFKLEQCENKMATTEEKYQTKMRNVQEECKKISQNISAKLNAIIRENQELHYQLEKAEESGKKLRDQEVQSLQDHVSRQDKVIVTLEKRAAETENQLKCTIEENNILKGTINQLHVQIDLLQHTFDAFEDTNDEIEQQLEELKCQLQEEHNQLKLKEQIISVQNEEIVNLRATMDEREIKIDLVANESQMLSEEARKIADEMKSISIALNKEIEEKQQTSADYPTSQDIGEKIQKLETTRIALEKMCKNTPKGDEARCAYLRRLVETLEKKIALMKEEMALRTQLLTRQKDRAVETAQFVTQKLTETVSDFQMQVQIHKKMRAVLTRVLTKNNSMLRLTVGNVRDALFNKFSFNKSLSSLSERCSKYSTDYETETSEVSEEVDITDYGNAYDPEDEDVRTVEDFD